MLEAENLIYNWEIDVELSKISRPLGLYYFFTDQIYGVCQIFNILKKYTGVN